MCTNEIVGPETIYFSVNFMKIIKKKVNLGYSHKPMPIEAKSKATVF